jgi:hypothetical protein
MIELTEQQSRELVEPETVAVDPRTNRQYVLVSKDVYEQLRGIADEDDVRRLAPLLADLDDEDWEDASAFERKS